MAWTQMVRKLLGKATRRAGKPQWRGAECLEGRVLLSITTSDLSTLTPMDLVNAILGSGVGVSNVKFTGDKLAGGTFAGGTGIIGFDGGLVLSSGKVADVKGPNDSTAKSTSFNTPGDTDLNSLLVAQTTNDAAVLEFDFVPSVSGELQFQYVFGSEEYNEWVNSSFNDVFGFFLNKKNIAYLPDGTTVVSINNINNGNAGAGLKGPGPGKNSTYFIDNATTFATEPPPAGSLDTQLDGLTVVLTAKANVVAGTTYHMKLAVADTSDTALDSAVFIKGGSFGLKTQALPVAPGVAGHLVSPILGTASLGSIDQIGNFTALINWGDGSAATVGSLQPYTDPNLGTVQYGISTASGPHIYKKPGTYTITFSLLDNSKGVVMAGLVTSIDILPSTLVSGTADQFTAQAGTQLTTKVGEVIDSNPWADATDYVAFVDWGDGSTPTQAQMDRSTSAPNALNGATFELTGTHTYDGTSPTRTVAYAVFNRNTGERLLFNSTTATVQTQRLTVEGGHVAGGTVAVLNADSGQVVQYITPFPGWTGGLNVATGDVTGDGIADFLIAPSVGGGPWVAIYDGATGQLRSQVEVFEDGDRLGVTLAAGDTNGDGIADIVAAEETGHRVRLLGGQDTQVWWEFVPAGFYMQRLSGTNDPFTTPADPINLNQPQTGPAYDRIYFNGGINVAMSDVNGDGFADIIVAPHNPVGGVGNFAAPVMYYDGRTSLLIHGTTPFGLLYTGGIQVAGGDITNDGHDDVLMMPDSTVAGAPAGTVFVHDVFNSTFKAVASLTGAALQPFVLSGTDYNLDGVRDFVLSGYTTTGTRVIRVISGGSFLPIFTMN